MKNKSKKINLKIANIMAENHYLKNRSSLIYGDQKIKYKKTKNIHGDDILLVNHYTKDYIINNNQFGLNKQNFTHPDKDVNPDEYNWVLTIYVDEIENLLKNI